MHDKHTRVSEKELRPRTTDNGVPVTHVAADAQTATVYCPVLCGNTTLSSPFICAGLAVVNCQGCAARWSSVDEHLSRSNDAILLLELPMELRVIRWSKRRSAGTLGSTTKSERGAFPFQDTL